jgi:SHS2 domain-containing protein
MESGFELFDHTADVGVRAWGVRPEELVAPATEGFYTTIGAVVSTGPAADETIDLAGDERAVLLRDYLAELLRLFACAGRRFAVREVREFSEARLVVIGGTQVIDREASDLAREVKAVTYHELRVERTAERWEATYIVDI